MKKIILFLAVALFVLIAVNPVDAKNDKKYAPPSEEAVESGEYDVKGRPDLKLRVFVYHGKPTDKPGKPTSPLPPPVEICGPANLNDPDSEAPVSNFGITLPDTWEYRLNPASVPAWVGSENLFQIAANAFKEWKDEVGNAVIVTKGDDTLVTRAQFDKQNIITWGRTSGSALAVSYLWYYPATGKMAEVDTIMNNKFVWAWSDPSGWPNKQVCAYEGVYDAQNILTHEMGHTFGLNDHYTEEYVNNTMYGYGSKGEVKKDTLTVGDINGVKAIYP